MLCVLNIPQTLDSAHPLYLCIMCQCKGAQRWQQHICHCTCFRYALCYVLGRVISLVLLCCNILSQDASFSEEPNSSYLFHCIDLILPDTLLWVLIKKVFSMVPNQKAA